MASFQVAGLSSGIDYSKMVDALVQAASKPLNQLKKKKTETETLQDLFDELNTKMQDLETKANSMNLSSEFVARKATSSDTTKLTATATGTASTGSHTVRIDQLAQVEREMHSGVSASTTSVNSSGSDKVFQYSYGGTQRSLTVADGTTLSGLQDLINQDSSNPGVTATIIDDGSGSSTAVHLVLSGNSSGYANNITIDSGTTVSNFGSSAFTETQSAKSAVIGVDGYPTSYTFQTEIEAYSGAGLGSGSSTVIYDSTAGTGNKVFEFTYGSITNTVTFTDDDATSYTLGNLITVLNGGSVTGISLSRSADGFITAASSGANNFTLTGADKGVAIAITSNTTLDGTDGTVNLETTMSNSQQAQGIVSSSNSVTTVIDGVTLELLDTSATNLSLTITTDTDAIKTKIEDLVDAYNEVMTYISENTKYDSNTKEAGPLFAESVPYIIQTQLKNIMTSAISGLTGTNTALAQIGIKSESDWSLTIDDTTLSSRLSAYPSEVIDIFSKNSTSGTLGVAEQLRSALFSMNSVVDGYITNRNDAINDLITDLNNQIATKETMMAKYEADLNRKFSALESLLSGFSIKGSALSQQIAQWQK